MLRVSRASLEELKSALLIALASLTDSKGLKVMIRVPEDDAESSALFALSLIATGDLNRFQPVMPEDVIQLDFKDGE